MSTKPIKRDKSLQPLSREHHHGLLLCWKIRTGISKKVEIKRVKKYCDWFFKNHIKPHFSFEEEHVFPILGNKHPLIERALSDHKRLNKLFLLDEQTENTLKLLAEELESHIRFEERQLFNEFQKQASPEQLHNIEKVNKETSFSENTEDVFWE